MSPEYFGRVMNGGHERAHKKGPSEEPAQGDEEEESVHDVLVVISEGSEQIILVPHQS